MIEQFNSWIGDQLSGSTGPWAFLFLALGGLAASFLPCVYPLYPITVSFLRNRTSPMGKFAHPLAYFLGMVGVYFILGFIAALSGGAFNEVLRIPLANLTIGVVMVLLALSIVDLLHIPFFGGQIESKNQKLPGTLVMGAGAGLLSSACVGPVVVSILIAIAQGSTQASFGTGMMAGFQLMLFGVGVGFPLLLLGVFGLTLPKGGKWMKWIQYLFALLIGYFAWAYFVKGLNGYGFKDQVAHYLLAGATLFAIGIYKIQNQDKPAALKTQLSLYALTATLGFFIMATQLLPASIGYAGSLNAMEATVEQKGALTWHLNKEQAYQKAGESGKLVFVDFHGDWCTNCKAFQEKTQSNQELNSALQNVVLYKVYDTSQEFEKCRNDPRFPELKVGLPFFLITDAEGNILYKTNDFSKTDEMILFMDQS